MNEAKFNKKFREGLSQYGFKIYRVESHSTSPGIPDNHLIHNSYPPSTSGWIEIKIAKTRPTKVPYRPGQLVSRA